MCTQSHAAVIQNSVDRRASHFRSIEYLIFPSWKHIKLNFQTLFTHIPHTSNSLRGNSCVAADAEHSFQYLMPSRSSRNRTYSTFLTELNSKFTCLRLRSIRREVFAKRFHRAQQRNLTFSLFRTKRYTYNALCHRLCSSCVDGLTFIICLSMN